MVFAALSVARGKRFEAKENEDNEFWKHNKWFRKTRVHSSEEKFD